MSMTVSVLGAAAALVYCNVDVVCYMGLEEFASQSVIYLALPGVSC